jgi:hypothetical protein
MKGILVHSTTFPNLESILEDGALYDSSKTEPEFGDGEDYQEILDNKIFFQLVFETFTITGEYKDDEGFSNSCLLFFDTALMEEYGHKKYVKSEEQKARLERLTEKKRKTYLQNEIQKTKVWFNPNWNHGGFHLKRKDRKEFSSNYNPELSLEDNIQNFYDAKVRYIQRTAPTDDLDEYEELLEDEDYIMPEEEKAWWTEHFKPEMPKTFTYKAKNEVVIQARRIGLKPTKKSKHLLAIYSYDFAKKFEKLSEKFPQHKFLKTPEELQEFIKDYYKS